MNLRALVSNLEMGQMTYTQSLAAEEHVCDARILYLDTSLLAEVESDITHICLHLLKCKLDAVVVLILDSVVRRELDEVVGIQCNNLREKIAALKGQVFDDKV